MIVGFLGVIHFPHPNNPKIKRVTRLVILPDYQGIGLGRQFLNIVSDYYVKQGFDFSIQTSAKNLIQALMHDQKWLCARYGHAAYQTNNLFARTSSSNRKTGTFFRKRVK